MDLSPMVEIVMMPRQTRFLVPKRSATMRITIVMEILMKGLEMSFISMPTVMVLAVKR